MDHLLKERARQTFVYISVDRLGWRLPRNGHERAVIPRENSSGNISNWQQQSLTVTAN